MKPAEPWKVNKASQQRFTRELINKCVVLKTKSQNMNNKLQFKLIQDY